MRFYVIEYDDSMSLGDPTRRIIETSKARTEAKLLDLLQFDVFGAYGKPEPRNVRLLLLNIPTPVNQSVLKDLLSGAIHKYRVDSEGNPAPQAAQASGVLTSGTVHVSVMKEVEPEFSELAEVEAEGVSETVPADADEDLPF